MPSDSALLDEILGYQDAPRGCSLPKLIANLTEAEQTALNAALANPAVHASAVRKFLHARGHVVGDRTVQRHRSGSCSCG